MNNLTLADIDAVIARREGVLIDALSDFRKEVTRRFDLVDAASLVMAGRVQSLELSAARRGALLGAGKVVLIAAVSAFVTGGVGLFLGG